MIRVASCEILKQLVIVLITYSHYDKLDALHQQRVDNLGQQIEERLMIPVGAGIVVQDGWKMADFVSDLRGEIGEQANISRVGAIYPPEAGSC